MDNINQKSKTIRWGIIGCGNVTEIKSGPAYQKTKGFELVAVMRRDAEKSDLFVHLLGEIKDVSGFSTNQQGLYSANDAITACWIHESGITGTGSWNFGCSEQEDHVEIIGSKGKIEFTIFDEKPIRLTNEQGLIELSIKHPENV